MTASNKKLLMAFYREIESQLKSRDSALPTLLHPQFEMHFPRTTSESPIIGAAALIRFLDTMVCSIYDTATLCFEFHFVISDAEYAHGR